MREDVELHWQQNFPTYTLGNHEIGVAEYQSAAERAHSDDNAISIANGLLLAALAPAIPVASPFLQKFLTASPLLQERVINLVIFVVALAFATAVVSSYFCHLRRSYVFSVRKVIVLRRMMGQSYGPTTLILPNWRLEGADNPFAVKMFPGWKLQNSYPYYAIAALAASVATYGFSLSAYLVIDAFEISLIVNGVGTRTILCVLVWVVWFALSLYFVRVSLFDTHENTLLVFATLVAKLLRLRLAGGMGTILYRARLARYEAHRLNFDLTVAKRYVVYREDRRFREHAGVDVRAIARSIGQRLKGNSAGGGTTITQQLARTLFIVDLNKKLRRKVIEVLLAYWLDRQVEKDEQLEIYLCAVRYARGVNGKTV